MPDITDLIQDDSSPQDRLLTGTAALKACGMQPEFAAHLMLMQQSSGTSIILRAGSPPVYDRPRAPKSGLNLSKTSNQGFFKGAIAADPTFTRLEGNKPKGHHEKDAAKLKKGEQPTAVLPIRLRDIVQQLGKDGELVLSEYIPGKIMRFRYKPEKGPAGFKGDFAIVLNDKNCRKPFIASESREWDKERDPTRSKKPDGFEMIDKEWKEFYDLANGNEFDLYYRQETSPTNPADLYKDLTEARVFAKEQDNPKLIISGDWDGLALGHPPDLPDYAKKVYNTFKKLKAAQIIEQNALLKNTLKLLGDFQGKIKTKQTNLSDEIYKGLIKKHFKDQPQPHKITKKLHKEKQNEAKKLARFSQYEQALLGLNEQDLVSFFALQRAGCITPFEFLNNCVANHLYKEKHSQALRDKQKMIGLQEGFESGIEIAKERIQQKFPLEKIIKEAFEAAKESLFEEQFDELLSQKLDKGIPIGDKALLKEQFIRSMNNNPATAKTLEHLKKSLIKKLTPMYQHAMEGGDIAELPLIQITHPDYDENIENLFQHGFDMRNPYGANLEGAWLMITNDGQIIYGQTEAKLIDVLLLEDFLERNHFDVNPHANMQLWGNVVEKQIVNGQKIPDATLKNFVAYVNIELSKGKIFPEKIMDMMPKEKSSMLNLFSKVKSLSKDPKVVSPQAESAPKIEDPKISKKSFKG